MIDKERMDDIREMCERDESFDAPTVQDLLADLDEAAARYEKNTADLHAEMDRRAKAPPLAEALQARVDELVVQIDEQRKIAAMAVDRIETRVRDAGNDERERIRRSIDQNTEASYLLHEVREMWERAEEFREMFLRLMR